MKRNKLLFLIIGIVLAVLIGNIALGIILFKSKYPFPSVSVSPTPEQKPVNYFLYKGEQGKNGLLLLQKNARVEKNSSGLVTGINNKKADDKNHEYWAFYVNGKLAQVGPAEYMTKEGDLIEWKIEKY